MEQNLLITIEEFEEAEKYWLDKLSGELSEVKIAGDFPGMEKYREGSYPIAFPPGLSERLAGISKNNDLSLYVILLTAFKILLFKYTGQKDILVASPVYTAGSREYNRCVVFRDFVDPGMTFRELLMTVKQTVVEGYENDHYPYEKHGPVFKL